MKNTFYGWRIVFTCMIFAIISWSLGVFGMGVYTYVLSDLQGFSIATVSTAVTTAYMISALLMVPVGRLITRYGSRPIIIFGICAMSSGLALMPHGQNAQQIYLAFLLLGLGMSCLSTNMIGSTLAPWFEKFQGRAMSTALLGASIGGMIGTPLLMGGIKLWGFQTTTIIAIFLALGIIIPLSLIVLKNKPEDIGLLPDGEESTVNISTSQKVRWNLKEAFATRQFKSHILAFGLAQMVQIGFLSHHVPIVIPTLGVSGAATAVFAAALAAFAGRLLLVRYADNVDVRKTAAGVFLFGAFALAGLAWFPGPWSLMIFSIAYGSTSGNITTLAPMIIRQEFGALSFGVVFGFAAMSNQLSMSLGPTLYGILKDIFGSYTPALLFCCFLNVFAACLILWGGKRPLTKRLNQTDLGVNLYDKERSHSQA